MASANIFIKGNLDKFNTAIANGYTFYYSNMVNVFANIPTALK